MLFYLLAGHFQVSLEFVHLNIFKLFILVCFCIDNSTWRLLMLLDRAQNMKILNKNNIMVTYRNIKDFTWNDDDFTISLYSSLLGIIMDWSCNENMRFEVRTYTAEEFTNWNVSIKIFHISNAVFFFEIMSIGNEL